LAALQYCCSSLLRRQGQAFRLFSHDVDALQAACLKFVEKNGPKTPPSPECCAAVKALSGAAVPCICHYLGSPAARENISLEKVFFVTKYGVTIPANRGSE
jgi:hypothetical protein